MVRGLSRWKMEDSLSHANTPGIVVDSDFSRVGLGITFVCGVEDASPSPLLEADLRTADSIPGFA